MEDLYEAALLLLALLLGFLALEKMKKRSRQKKQNLPPGPRGLPLIGSFLQLGNQPHCSLAKLSKLHGPLMFLKFGQVPALVVSSPAAAEELLKTHDRDSSSRPSLVAWKQLSFDFSDVSLAPYGDSWRELRKILVVNLLSAKKVEGYRKIREEEVGRMIGSISPGIVDLSEILQRLSNGVICRIGLRRRLEVGGELEKSFDRILREVRPLTVGSFYSDYFPCCGWLDKLKGNLAALEKCQEEMEAFCKKTLAAYSIEEEEDDEEEGIIGFMLRRQKDNSDITMDNVKGILMDILLAATDTSAATLEYAMAELVRNPRTMVKAREEVRAAVGGKGKVEEKDIARLVYLKSVVKETLRLRPVSPLLLPRETIGGMTVGGYDIPPKTRLIVNAWAIARDPASWERPEEFFPERFVDDPVEFKGQDFKFIPFGAGRRICPGMPFGVMTVELALANLLYAFDWSVPSEMGEEGIDMAEGVGLAVRLKNPLRLKASSYTEFKGSEQE